MAKKIWIRKNDGMEMVEETAFSTEGFIQGMFNDNPEVIPVDDLGLSRLMVVGRESAFDAGYPDLIAVTETGDIVIIEFKNDGNAEARRKVIGQLLDYGASLWKNFGDYESFDKHIATRYFGSKYCTDAVIKDSLSLEVAARDFFKFEISDEGEEEGAENDLEAFRDALSDNLKKGVFVYVVVCPELPDTAKHIIEYLSVCSNLRIYGVELEYFKHQGIEVVCPSGLAYASAKKAAQRET
jgi:hypothetical protein